MSVDRLWESIHGHLGVLAAIALIHPAILLWNGRPLSRGIRLSIVLSAMLAVGAFAFGIASYDEYRAVVRTDLFRADSAAGYLFETKEHLAYATVMFATAGALTAWFAPPQAQQVRAAAARMYAAAALACVVVGALGTYVAAVRGF